MIKKIYIDTSVFGGKFDKEFDDATNLFFDYVIKSEIIIVISEVLELEILRAPAKVIAFYDSLPEKFIYKVSLTTEASNLAEMYINEKVVGKTSRADCQHIALATINNVDVLVSWNFKHIVNLEKIRGYNSINFRQGYQMTEIRTPKEIFSYENNSN